MVQFCRWFTAAAFAALSERSKLIYGDVYVCLTLDEMAIRKKLNWDGKQFVGYVERGCGVQNEELVEAKETLVLLVVGINNWKIPIAYFLVNSTSSAEKFGVVQNALRLFCMKLT